MRFPPKSDAEMAAIATEAMETPVPARSQPGVAAILIADILRPFTETERVSILATATVRARQPGGG